MMPLLWKTLLDLKHPAILWRLFLPFLMSMALVSILGYSFFGLLLTSDWLTQNAYVVEMNTAADNVEEWLASIPVIGAILVWTILSLFTLLVGIVSFLLGSYLVLIVALIITAFMTDSLVKAVRDIHYPSVEYQGHGNFFGLIMKMLGYGAFLLLLLLLGVPLLFIPLVNLVWLWFLGFLFFRYAVLLDVGQVVLSDQEFQAVRSLWQSTPTLGLMLIYALTVFPLVSFFAPVIAVIFLAHWTLRIKTT